MRRQPEHWWNSLRRISRSSPLAALLFGLLLAAPVVLGTAGDGATSKSDAEREVRASIHEELDVELSLVEVVVLDRKGRHVRGLPASAFHLQEGKQDVELLTFDEFDLGTGSPVPVRSAMPEGDAAVSEDPGVTQAPPSLEAEKLLRSRLTGERWFVLLFDGYNNVSPLRLSQARRAAKKWIKGNLRDFDHAAVFELTPFMTSLTGFTNDPEVLIAGIDSVHMFPGTNVGTEFIQQQLEGGLSIDRAYQEARLVNAMEFGNNLLNQERDQFYVNIAGVADILQDMEGTRSIVLFSGGFPLTRTRATNARGGFTERFNRMLESLEREGIRVFSFDTGVEGGFTDAEVAVNTRIQVDNLGLGTEWLDRMQLGIQADAVNAHQEILHVLGNETGGRFFRSHDYAAGLEAALDDLEHYYLVGYQPPEQVRDRKSRYRPIRVKVEGRGLKVITRKGRFTKDAEPLKAVSAAVPVLEEKAGQEKPVVAPPVLDLSCSARFYPGPDGKTLVVFPFVARGPLESFPAGDGEFLLDMSLEVLASSGGQVIERNERTIRATLNAAGSRSLQAGLWFHDAILLQPANYDLEVRLRFNGLGFKGVWEKNVTIPSIPPGLFGLTDIAVFSPAEPGFPVFDVFVSGEPVAGTAPGTFLVDPLGDAAGRPLSYSGRSFPRKLPLVVQVGVTAPPPPSQDGGSPLKMDWELIPVEGREQPVEIPPVRYRRLNLTGGGDYLDVVVDLDLAAVPPGDYLLRLTAVHIGSGETAVRESRLLVGS